MGVYYASNAVGRLTGTLASGALYSYVGSSVVDGFGTCLMVSVTFAGISFLVDFFLHEEANAAGGARRCCYRNWPPAGGACACLGDAPLRLLEGKPSSSHTQLVVPCRAAAGAAGRLHAGGQAGVGR